MPLGGGKYDFATDPLIRMTEADVVAVLVLGGSGGSGFSVAARGLQFLRELPRVLRETADQVEADMEKDIKNLTQPQ